MTNNDLKPVTAFVHRIFNNVIILPNPEKVIFTKLKISQESGWFIDERKLHRVDLCEIDGLLFALLNCLVHLSYRGLKIRINETFGEIGIVSNIKEGIFKINLNLLKGENICFTTEITDCEGLLTLVKCFLDVLPLTIRQGHDYSEHCADISLFFCRHYGTQELFTLLKRLVRNQNHMKISLIRPYLRKYYEKSDENRMTQDMFQERLIVYKSYYLAIFLATYITYEKNPKVII